MSIELEDDCVVVTTKTKSWSAFERDGQKVEPGSSVTIWVLSEYVDEPITMTIPAQEGSWRHAAAAWSKGDVVRLKFRCVPVVADANRNRAGLRFELIAVEGDHGVAAARGRY